MKQTKINTRSFFIVVAVVLMFSMASVALATEVSDNPVEGITSTMEEVSNVSGENVVPTSAGDVVFEDERLAVGGYWGCGFNVPESGYYKFFYAVNSANDSTRIELSLNTDPAIKPSVTGYGRVSGILRVYRNKGDYLGVGVLLNNTSTTFSMISVEKD